MKEVLFNLANLHLIEFCKTHNIDCSGSRVIKVGRGFKYSLVSIQTNRTIASLTFTKNSTPRFETFRYKA